MKTSIPIVCALLLVGFTLTSCETPGRTAALGAATGAIIGRESYTGPLRGAAIGAGVGYLVGKLFERDRYYDHDRYYYPEDPSYGRGRYPVARPTSRDGFVTSPYRPYNLIDVRGIPRGAKVVDPSCDRVFINP